MKENNMIKTIAVTLKPLSENGQISAIETTLLLREFSYGKGELFAEFPRSLAGCVTADYDNDTIEMFDDSGSLYFEINTVENEYDDPTKEYRFSRDVKGDLHIKLTAPVLSRDFSRGDPGLSVYRQCAGCSAPAEAFLLLPKGTYNFSVDYDLSGIDAKSYNLCGHGEGAFTKTCDSEVFKETYFCFGAKYKYNPQGSNLNIIYFDDRIHLIDEFCKMTGELFDTMSALFHDENAPYYIILYPTPRTVLTGTAMIRCCFMGFGCNLISDIKEIEDTLTHELVHNWLEIKDESHLTSLYDEGTADYYADNIRYRIGRLTAEEYADSLNEKLRFFYSNPRCCDPYEEVYDQCWTHTFAQRISYGRGLILMMYLDTLIQKHTAESDTKKSLDDLVIKLADMRASGQMPDWNTFITEADALTDGAAQKIAGEIAEGGLLMPPFDFFEVCLNAPQFTLSKENILMEDNGYDDRVQFDDPEKVFGLREDSNAFRAGLRNGDILLSYTSDWDSSKSEKMYADYLILRDGKELSLRFIPRGKETLCWQYCNAKTEQ